MKIRNRQDGFSAVEGLLIAVIVIMIAGVGVYILRTTQKANKTYSVPVTTSSVLPSEKTVANLPITQLGINIPLVNQIADMTYTWDSSNDVVTISSKTILQAAEKADPGKCSPTSPESAYPISVITTNTPASSANGAAKPAVVTKTINKKNYYWSLPSNEGNCDLNISVGTQEAAYYEHAVKQFLKATALK